MKFNRPDALEFALDAADLLDDYLTDEILPMYKPQTADPVIPACLSDEEREHIIQLIYEVFSRRDIGAKYLKYQDPYYQADWEEDVDASSGR